jgi:hypothetical protein
MLQSIEGSGPVLALCGAGVGKDDAELERHGGGLRAGMAACWFCPTRLPGHRDAKSPRRASTACPADIPLFQSRPALMSYGPDQKTRPALGAYVDRILKGTKPSSCRRTKFELVINLKTAESAGSPSAIAPRSRRGVASGESGQ